MYIVMQLLDISQVGEKIGQQAGVNARAIVACFLVQEGADILIKNEVGLTPLEGDCPADVAILVQGFAEENGRYLIIDIPEISELSLCHSFSARDVTTEVCVYLYPYHHKALSLRRTR